MGTCYTDLYDLSYVSTCTYTGTSGTGTYELVFTSPIRVGFSDSDRDSYLDGCYGADSPCGLDE